MSYAMAFGLVLSGRYFSAGIITSGNFRSSHANLPRTMKTLSDIEINEAAITVPRKFSATIPVDRATCTTMNDSSPICASRTLRQLPSRVGSGTAALQSSRREICRP